MYMLSLPFTSPLNNEPIGLFYGHFNSTRFALIFTSFKILRPNTFWIFHLLVIYYMNPFTLWFYMLQNWLFITKLFIKHINGFIWQVSFIYKLTWGTYKNHSLSKLYSWSTSKDWHFDQGCRRHLFNNNNVLDTLYNNFMSSSKSSNFIDLRRICR